MKSTKETQDAKEDLQRKEQMKEAAKKRAEKLADAEAKKRIKAKIEADREERRLKAEAAKAVREGRPAAPATAASSAPVAASTPAAPKPAASHSEARLRFQLATGTAQKTLPADTTLFEVVKSLETEHGIVVTKLEMTYPRKVFQGNADFAQTLREAGLLPSAVLRVS